MKNEVKVLKLTTGEEIITRMTEGEDGTIILDRPLEIKVVGPDASGRTGVSLNSWLHAGNTDKITLDSKHVLVIVKPSPTAEKNYLSSITGISL